jgi:hypothetical protein
MPLPVVVLRGGRAQRRRTRAREALDVWEVCPLANGAGKTSTNADDRVCVAAVRWDASHPRPRGLNLGTVGWAQVLNVAYLVALGVCGLLIAQRRIGKLLLK